ncbi:ABC transporter permease [Paenibacillus herberti]|uniref:ABC transporter permease n=1 Tax=Paenibacillus herberti TaxID=1619309 RepID=A0A229NZW2_9BACL|nr:ABC transporter permease subunit [Paenibacillus herberti]OXM15274.1 ABC transporter permease [Paenibacillus herberti]
MNILHIARREIKLGFRNPWSYSFLALFTVFTLLLLMIGAQSSGSGYTSTTGSMLNLILYLLPLMTLLIGSFSLTAEKEEGSWQLISTYSLRTLSFIAGKYAGLTVVLATIVSFAYGVSGVAGAVVGSGFDLKTLGLFLVFSLLLVLLYLAVALLIGTFAANRWQALTYAVAFWFFTVIGWPALLIAVLGFLPYLMIKPALVALTFLNPAELVRLFVVVKLGGGTILGPEYYQWVMVMQKSTGSLLFAGLCLLWIGVAGGIAVWAWERGRYRA